MKLYPEHNLSKVLSKDASRGQINGVRLSTDTVTATDGRVIGEVALDGKCPPECVGTYEAALVEVKRAEGELVEALTESSAFQGCLMRDARVVARTDNQDYPSTETLWPAKSKLVCVGFDPRLLKLVVDHFAKHSARNAVSKAQTVRVYFDTETGSPALFVGTSRNDLEMRFLVMPQRL